MGMEEVPLADILEKLKISLLHREIPSSPPPLHFSITFTENTSLLVLLAIKCVGLSPAKQLSVTPAGLSTIQLNSDTALLAIASDPSC